ncbi:MAG TPA: hypothetical protein VFG51_02885 [Candidatus Saccharimonadia bacterium]|nr:hypothetical protein [Candidatus Saccharimonadia bacterium]
MNTLTRSEAQPNIEILNVGIDRWIDKDTAILRVTGSATVDMMLEKLGLPESTIVLYKLSGNKTLLELGTPNAVLRATIKRGPQPQLTLSQEN